MSGAGGLAPPRLHRGGRAQARCCTERLRWQSWLVASAVLRQICCQKSTKKSISIRCRQFVEGSCCVHELVITPATATDPPYLVGSILGKEVTRSTRWRIQDTTAEMVGAPRRSGKFKQKWPKSVYNFRFLLYTSVLLKGKSS